MIKNFFRLPSDFSRFTEIKTLLNIFVKITQFL